MPTKRQRRALLRERPQVQSWALLLDAARRAYYTAQLDAAERRRGAAGFGAGAGREDGDQDGPDYARAALDGPERCAA